MKYILLNLLTKVILFSFLILTSSFHYSQKFEWAKSIGAKDSDNGYFVTTDKSGNIFLIYLHFILRLNFISTLFVKTIS